MSGTHIPPAKKDTPPDADTRRAIRQKLKEGEVPKPVRSDLDRAIVRHDDPDELWDNLPV